MTLYHTTDIIYIVGQQNYVSTISETATGKHLAGLESKSVDSL